MKPATTEDVLDLLNSYVISAALGAAIELGLFWLLAERPLDGPSVAQVLKIPLKRCQYWLQLLRKAGLLEQVSNGYVPSSTARTAILEAHSQDSWAFLAQEERQRFPAVRDLALRIREPGSAWAAQGLRPPNYFAQMVESPEQARRFTRMLYEIHRPLAEDLAESLDMSGVARLMDLGGGSGVMSLALLRRYPRLTAVVVDIANVCAAGRDLAVENSLEERITYHATDFLRDELPSGFDMVLECDVNRYPEALFRKIQTALNPGGRLIIVDQLAPAEGVPHASRLHWAFQGSLANPDYTPLTAAEIQTRLTQAGFQLLSEGTLPQRESLRWSDSWVMIEARKPLWYFPLT